MPGRRGGNRRQMTATVNDGTQIAGTTALNNTTAFRDGLYDTSSKTLAGSEKNLVMSSMSGKPRSPRTHTSSASTIRDNNSGIIPVALLPSESTSITKAPTNNSADWVEGAAEEKAEYLPPNSQGAKPTTPAHWGGSGDAAKTLSAGSSTFARPHESLVPKPLSVGRSGMTARQKTKEQATESGWWGALASVIYTPQAEYDPSNVL